MNTNEHESTDAVIKAVIEAACEVSNQLGSGFLEKIYERAMTRELALRGLDVKSQVSYSVTYKECHLGAYIADLVVDNRVLVELKCVDTFSSEHVAQCINYLRASKLRFALLVNFQHPKVHWKRIILG